MPAEGGSFSVSDVIARQSQLIGKRINIHGELRGCQGLSCGLSEEQEGAERYLSIGISEEFDASVQELVGHRIEIRATVTGRCMSSLDPDTIVACSDRPETLAYPVLIRPL